MTTRIRRAAAADLESILPLVQAYHAFEGIDSTPATRESALRRLLDEPALGGIWLIYSGRELAGYIVLCRGFSIEFNGFDAFIDEFYLRSEYRGRGMGKAVLQSIRQEARRLDINALHLEVARDNTPALGLYSACGFEARDRYVLMSASLHN